MFSSASVSTHTYARAHTVKCTKYTADITKSCFFLQTRILSKTFSERTVFMLISGIGDIDFKTFYSVTITGVPLHKLNNFRQTKYTTYLVSGLFLMSEVPRKNTTA